MAHQVNPLLGFTGFRRYPLGLLQLGLGVLNDEYKKDTRLQAPRVYKVASRYTC